MKIIEILFYGVVALWVLNFFVLAAYCRVQKKIDAKVEDKHKDEAVKSISKPIDQQSKKKFFHVVYWKINRFCYGLMRYSIIRVGKIPSHKIRKFLYRYVFDMKITRKTVIHGGCEFRSPWNITIGNSIVGVDCILDGRNKIIVGNNVVFGTAVHIWTEEHDVNDPWFGVSKEGKKPVIIKDRSWICSDTTILPGSKIAEGTVLAARACLTKDTQEFSVYAGVPAKKIQDRNKNLMYELNGNNHWAFY